MDPSGAIGPVIEKITDRLFNFLERRIGYVVHCNGNIRQLEDGVEALRAQMQTVQGRVQRARDNAEEIEPNVSEWLSRVGALLEGADQTVADTGSLKCGYGWCPNIRARHRLGKEAENKLKDVVQLTHSGKFDSVGHRPPLADIRFEKSTADNHQGFESRAAVFNEIMEALQDDNVYTIGIYGMAGVGKTTMACDVAKQAGDRKLFDKIVQVTISQNPDLRKVQGELADFLGLKFDQESLAGRASLLCARFKQKREEKGEKILVVIDDVWNEIKLEEIGIPLMDYIKGCKIVLTSRRRDVCIQMEVQKEFQIGVLSESEAWSLFKHRVGRTTIDSHGIRSVAEEVCKECAGLPLAIVTLGGALKKKKPHAWNETLGQLKSCKGNYVQGMAANVYVSIELSYQFLEHPDTKACFLYCCLYPEDAEISIEDLVRYGVGTRFLLSRDKKMEAARERVSTIIDDLKASCLLIGGGDEKSVKMHDIIRDVAISIASKDTNLMLLVKIGVEKWPDEEELKWCRTLYLTLENIKVLPDELECPELRTLVLDCSSRDSVGIPSGLFKTTKKLEVLSLHNLRMSPTLESSISDLVNLRMLCLHKCKLENVDFVKELQKLEILSLNGSTIYELSLEVRKLSHLRVLDLRRCRSLHKISPGIISNLSYLEELYSSDMVYSDFKGWDMKGNASIGELNSLRYLTNLEACIPVKAWSLHELQCVTSLIRFKICIGCHFDQRESHLETRSLKLMDIELTGGAQVLMKEAEALYLVDPRGLQEVLRHMDRGWFLNLKFLKVECCEDEMEYLLGKPNWNIEDGPSPSPSPSPLGKLSKLTVSNCRLKSLFSPSIVRCLPQLQEVGVEDCGSMVEIVGEDEQVDGVLVFPQLKQIALWGLPNLRGFSANTNAQALFNGKVSFPILEKLIIGELESITTIWDNQLNLEGADAFQWLQHFDVCKCQKLVHLVRSIVFPKFQDLVNLIVLNCPSLTSIIEVVNIAKGSEIQKETEQAADDDDRTMVFPKLESISLRNLPNMKCFYSNFESKEKEKGEDQLLQVKVLFNHKP